ncbi:hypothetical protein HDU93_003404, partial [Gonapodya sp. JEL0774]
MTPSPTASTPAEAGSISTAPTIVLQSVLKPSGDFADLDIPLVANAPNSAPGVLPTSDSSTTEISPRTPITVRGYDFNNGVDWGGVIGSLQTTGFQATNLGRAIEEVNIMLNARINGEDRAKSINKTLDHRFGAIPSSNSSSTETDPSTSHRPTTPITIILSYTSNLVSSGLRESIRFLAQHQLVDILITTAGGIEEDVIKCLGNTVVGGFGLKGAQLRGKGLNRVGNLLVPNDNYVKFEDWVMSVLDGCWKEQQENGVVWTPSQLIHRLGREINNEDSIYYWAYKNNIPVFCPALTDGSLGDMLYLHSFKHTPPLTIDITRDVRTLNDLSVWSNRVGVIILGGGVAKHHTLNACMMRNGAEHCVFVNTGVEMDGSDAGASTDEA